MIFRSPVPVFTTQAGFPWFDVSCDAADEFGCKFVLLE